jgi:putative DNA primase/helicase
MLLGTPGGTVDLRTGELRPARPEDMITKSTTVTPSEDEDCPEFERFLHQITQGDTALVAFFIRWFGYNLTADIREQKLLLVHGPGGNGKGVLTHVIAAIFGDYAKAAAMTTFNARHFDAHPEELASLEGARLVTASETEFGKHWAEARIKELTGGDPISCRKLYGHRYSYIPTFKLTFVGNLTPMLQEVDQAIRRCFLVVFISFRGRARRGRLLSLIFLSAVVCGLL